MKEQTSKKSKNYVLSNNVVINLANLPTRRRRQRKRTNKPSSPLNQSPQGSMPQGYTLTQPTRFSNVSNLDTQLQQALLRTIDNGDRFNNSTNLLTNANSNKLLIEDSVKTSCSTVFI